MGDNSRDMSLDATTITPRDRLAAALQGIAQGDRSAFDDLHKLTARTLLGVCLRICGNREAAEDTLHDVYLVVLRRAGSYDSQRGAPYTWLAAIARNRAIDWRRRQGMRRTSTIDVALTIADPAPSAESTMIANHEVTSLLRHLETLQCRQRDAIREAFFGGRTYAEIATRRDVPLGTLKGTIRRGLARLRRELTEQE